MHQFFLLNPSMHTELGFTSYFLQNIPLCIDKSK